MTGLGIIAGTTLPMIMKGSGMFADAPDLMSTSGIVLMLGLGVVLVGVVLSSLAGFGRAKVLSGSEAASPSQGQKGSFAIGLVMAVIAGVTSAGIALCFVYAQDPIVEAMKAQGADNTSANLAVWAVALMSGAAVNIIFPAWIMTKKRNWGELLNNPGEALLATIIGVQFIIAVTLMGRGMLFLGVFGASVGFAIQQIMQITGNQAVGFLSGEWKNVDGKPRQLMYAALAVLGVAFVIVAISKALA
jgi:L-rhamnose-H+ transport protein